MISTPESFCRRSSSMTLLAGLAAADDHRAAGEAAFARPFAHQQEQQLARGDQRDQAADIEAAEPDAREHLAGFGEERRADDDQEHHRPGRGEPHVLLLVAAEGLHLVDVGGLEGEHRQQRDGEDRDERSARTGLRPAADRRQRSQARPATISANSAMRTKPASTIGEIGAGVGVAATASASGDSEWALAAARGAARRRSRTAAALGALSDGRVSVSVMADAIHSAGRAHPAQRQGFSLNSRKFLGKKSQKRLIGPLRKCLNGGRFRCKVSSAAW